MINESFIFLFAKNSENIEEKSDDVGIYDHGSHSIVVQWEFISFSSHDQLNVNQQVNCVNYSQSDSNKQVSHRASDKEYVYQADPKYDVE